MTAFEKWNERYKKRWCTKDQLKRLVTLGVLIVDEELGVDEYKKITGEDHDKQS